MKDLHWEKKLLEIGIQKIYCIKIKLKNRKGDVMKFLHWPLPFEYSCISQPFSHTTIQWPFNRKCPISSNKKNPFCINRNDQSIENREAHFRAIVEQREKSEEIKQSKQIYTANDKPHLDARSWNVSEWETKLYLIKK
jgi:hypothetical protein